VRRSGRILIAALAVSLGSVGTATAAAAAPPDKPAVLSSWTQVSASSFTAWNAARKNQAAWAAYGFDWVTNYCSFSPDNPLGFDFKLACYRHDFGYGNYEAAGQFAEHKDRLDSAFYQDMGRSCDTYNAVVRPACDSLAWTYYQAVRRIGDTVVAQEDIDRAARMKADAEREAAAP
jgi:hypothetical protein